MSKKQHDTASVEYASGTSQAETIRELTEENERLRQVIRKIDALLRPLFEKP